MIIPRSIIELSQWSSFLKCVLALKSMYSQSSSVLFLTHSISYDLESRVLVYVVNIKHGKSEDVLFIERIMLLNEKHNVTNYFYLLCLRLCDSHCSPDVWVDRVEKCARTHKHDKKREPSVLQLSNYFFNLPCTRPCYPDPDRNQV